MIKTHLLAAALGLMLGTFAFGPVQAEEQGLRPLPEDIAAQADEKTEETMPFPEGSLQVAPQAPADTVQDADINAEDLAAAEDFSSQTAAPPGSLSPATRFFNGDKDGTGALTPAELDALDKTLVFAELDGDADGSISRAEWNSQMTLQRATADSDE